MPSLPTPSDAGAHQVSLYFADPDALGRTSMLVNVLDAATGKQLDTRKVNETLDGKYLVYQISGPVKFQVWFAVFWNSPVPWGQS